MEALEAPVAIPRELAKDHHKRKHHKIIAKVTEIHLQEAERSQKKRMGEIPFSHEWSEAALQLQAWLAVLKWKNKGEHKQKIRGVRFLIKEAKLEGVFKMSLPEIKNWVRLAKNTKRK